MGFKRLEKNLIDIIKEEQAKLGFRKEEIRLYYPLISLNHFFEANDDVDEMQTRLEQFPEEVKKKLGDICVTHKKDRFCLHIPEQGSVYVHEHMAENEFIKKLVARAGIAPKDARPGLAYAISKHFVIWFAKTDAARFGGKNVRCLSGTPGNFDTPMGALESGQADVFKKYSALKRNGKPEEIAALFALLLDERLGFLTGADILMDGGVVASGASGLSK